jgi:hypothetical protein
VLVDGRHLPADHRAHQQARARGHLHNRALRGKGARWTRNLWRCWIDDTTYDQAVHLKQQPAITVRADTSEAPPPARVAAGVRGRLRHARGLPPAKRR